LAATKTTQLVNIRDAGWPKGPDDVYIGRGNDGDCRWGNPYIIGRDGNRYDVIEKYRSYLAGRDDLIRDLPQLAGKTLYCFCQPLLCHGGVLIEELRKRYPHLA
jgi:uncharacterized protein DUF4326